jgi:hypothetical protein
MAAQWISDGTEVPSVPLKPAPAPYREWRIGCLEFRRTRRQGRWACQTTQAASRSCGIAGARTPLGAFLAVWRMLRAA